MRSPSHSTTVETIRPHAISIATEEIIVNREGALDRFRRSRNGGGASGGKTQRGLAVAS